MAGRDTKKGKAGEVAAPSIGGKSSGQRSKGTGARGARKVRLTDMEKVLLVNGGIGHRLRRNKVDPRKAPNAKVGAKR